MERQIILSGMVGYPYIPLIRPSLSQEEQRILVLYEKIREFTIEHNISVCINGRVYNSNRVFKEQHMENPIPFEVIAETFRTVINDEYGVCIEILNANKQYLPFDHLPVNLRKFSNLSRGFNFTVLVAVDPEKARLSEMMQLLKEAMQTTHKNQFGVEEWPICYRRKEVVLLKKTLEACREWIKYEMQSRLHAEKRYLKVMAREMRNPDIAREFKPGDTELSAGTVFEFCSPKKTPDVDPSSPFSAVMNTSVGFRAHSFMKTIIETKGKMPEGYTFPSIFIHARQAFSDMGVIDKPLAEIAQAIETTIISFYSFRLPKIERVLKFFAVIHTCIIRPWDPRSMQAAVELGLQNGFISQSEKSDLLRLLSNRDYSAPSQPIVTKKPQDPSTRAADPGENMKKSFTFQLLSDFFKHMGPKAECRILPPTLLENLDKARRNFEQIGTANSVSNLIRKRQYNDLYRLIMDIHRERFVECFGTLSDPKSNSDILSPALPHWALIFAFLCYAPKNNQLPEEAIRAILDIVRITESVTPEEYVDLEELAGIDEQDDRTSALNEFIVAVNTFKGNMYHLLMTLLTSHREYGIDLNTNPTEAENLYRKADIFLEKWGVVPNAPLPFDLVDLVKNMSVCRAECNPAPILDLVMFFTNLKLYITEKNDNYFPGLVCMAEKVEFITKEQATTLNQKFIEKKDLDHSPSEFRNMCPRYRRECPDREINTIGDIVHILREFVCPKVFNAGTGYFYQPSPYRWLSGQCVCSAYTRAEDRVLERRCLMDQKTGAVLAKEMSKQTPFTITGKPVGVSSPHLDTDLVAFDKMVSASQRLEIVRRLRTIATTGACMQQSIGSIEHAAHELLSFSGAGFDIYGVMKSILSRGQGSLPIVMGEIEKVLVKYIDRKQITEKCYRILVFLATVFAYQDASSDYRFSKEDLIFLLSRCRNDGLIVQSEYESLLRIGCR